MIYSIKKTNPDKGKAEKNEASVVATPVFSEPVPVIPSEPATASDNAGFRFSLDSRDLLNGIILSEVLGKPKCLRRGR